MRKNIGDEYRIEFEELKNSIKSDNFEVYKKLIKNFIDYTKNKIYGDDDLYCLLDNTYQNKYLDFYIDSRDFNICRHDPFSDFYFKYIYTFHEDRVLQEAEKFTYYGELIRIFETSLEFENINLSKKIILLLKKNSNYLKNSSSHGVYNNQFYFKKCFKNQIDKELFEFAIDIDYDRISISYLIELVLSIKLNIEIIEITLKKFKEIGYSQYYFNRFLMKNLLEKEKDNIEIIKYLKETFIKKYLFDSIIFSKNKLIPEDIEYLIVNF